MSDKDMKISPEFIAAADIEASCPVSVGGMPPLSPGDTVLWRTTWDRPAWCRNGWMRVRLPRGRHMYMEAWRVIKILRKLPSLCWIPARFDELRDDRMSASITIINCEQYEFGVVSLADIRIPEHEEPK